MADLGMNALVRLAFQARAIAPFEESVLAGPGYKEAEWERLAQLAGAVNRGALARATLIEGVVKFVVALTTLLIILQVESIPVVKAHTAALPFVVLFGGGLCFIVCVSLLVSKRVAPGLAATPAIRARLKAEPGDAALAAKLNRRELFMLGMVCAVVAGTLALVAYGMAGSVKASPLFSPAEWLLGILGLVVVYRLYRRYARR
jgi:hypothetical protein